MNDNIMTTEPKKQVAVRFPESLKARTEDVATRMGLNFSDIVRLAVLAQLPDLERGRVSISGGTNAGTKSNA